MKVSINKTIVVELSDTEAFAIKTFIELGIKELKDIPGGYINNAKKLVSQLDENKV